MAPGLFRAGNNNVSRNPGPPVMKWREIIAISSYGLTLLIGLTCGAATSGDASSNSPKSGGANQLKREGAEFVDILGQFRMTGDRATFYPKDSQAGYAGLENLNLERVSLMISDTSDQLLWQVSGTITEYRGMNYILVTKAILKNQTETPETPGGLRRAPGAAAKGH